MAQREALVIGAGIGGLLTAKALAGHVDHVTIIDRDGELGSQLPRKGVPQGRHAHGLLPSGEAVIRQWFPGLIEELVAGGAQSVTTEQCRWWQYGGYRTAAPSPDGTFLSRPFLENGLRGRIDALPQVTVVRARVEGLHVDNRRVVGVVAARGDGPVVIPGDLVVDASGRASGAGRWLTANGYPQPPVAEIQIDMGYATRLYHRTPGRLPAGTWMITISDPEVSTRLAVAFPIEGDRWIVTLAGMHGDHAPTDEDGFLQWADTLPTSDVAGIIRSEEPIGAIATHRLATDQWRHFEKVRRHPPGFVAIGDAICSFNPIYGQGMSSAALQAVALEDCLGRVGVDSPQLPALFYRAAAKVISRPWAIAAGGDFCFAETTGARPPMVDGVNSYVKKAIIAAQRDPKVATAVWEVQGLLAPPPSLMKPAMVVRVLRGARRGPTGHPAVPAVTAARVTVPI